MSANLVEALAALAVAIVLTIWSLMRYRRSVGAVLQLVGAAGFVVVAVAHVCEAARLLPSMGWGEPRSAGHYLDLSAALLGIVLFPIGLIAGRGRFDGGSS